MRGEDTVSVIDASTYHEVRRITVPYGPGMTIFSPDDRYGYVCSSCAPETVVIDRTTHEIVRPVKQTSPFCPNIAVTPDGSAGVGDAQGYRARRGFQRQAPFQRSLHPRYWADHEAYVNIVRNANGQFAYVTIGGLNEVKDRYTTGTQPKLVATIPTNVAAAAEHAVR